MLQGIASMMVSKVLIPYVVSDSDAQAFLTAISNTDTNIAQAIDQLVISAKANGWWSLCSAIYPMVGGVESSHKYNLKDPRDLNAAFRLTFSGSWIHDARGAKPDGTTAYADTYLVPNSVLTNNNTHLGYYSFTEFDDGNNKADIGCSSGGGGVGMLMYISQGYSIYAFIGDGATILYSSTMSSSRGLALATRTSSTSVKTYKNGVNNGENTSTNTVGLPTTSIYLGASNGGSLSPRGCSFATIGAGVTSTMAALMNTDIEAFQTTLGRQV